MIYIGGFRPTPESFLLVLRNYVVPAVDGGATIDQAIQEVVDTYHEEFPWVSKEEIGEFVVNSGVINKIKEDLQVYQEYKYGYAGCRCGGIGCNWCTEDE